MQLARTRHALASGSCLSEKVQIVTATRIPALPSAHVGPDPSAVGVSTAESSGAAKRVLLP
jgi:hypothetical protein